ncbi:MAG TPA: PilZ domain-containing protein [Fimbriiglobus sp.]|jgi:hypothetical protein
MNETSHPPSPSDRRVAPRFRPAFGTLCRFDPVGGKGLSAVGLVCDISQTGVSMLIATPPDPGAVITGELALESGEPHLSVVFRVIHVRPVSTGDYLLGAQFHRILDTEELRPFLIPPPKPTEPVEPLGIRAP